MRTKESVTGLAETGGILGNLLTGIWNMSTQLTNACPMNSNVKADEDHCSQGMFKPDRP